MKKIVLLVGCCWYIIGYSQQRYWQQEVNYTIDVSLNDSDATLDGFVKIQYTNHSPDSLSFIWFHVWPNAFKTDRTAFSDQSLQNGSTKFYFADKENRGYINRLDFRVDGEIAKTEDHPQYIDIIKLVLPKPLGPGQSTLITTPFHEKIPENFSRGGHTGQSFQLTQWYPKPAVYDRFGWHPMPYLDMGEFYSEFGSFDVRITVPENYVVAATGELQNEDEKKWLLQRAGFSMENARPVIQKTVATTTHSKSTTGAKKKPGAEKSPKTQQPKTATSSKKSAPANPIPSASTTKTLQFKQDRVHDFAWFADKSFIVNHDTMQLASGRIIDVYTYYAEKNKETWKKGTRFLKDAVRFRSAQIGEYPFAVVSAVEAKMGFTGGMEYPTITSISPTKDEHELDMTLEHEAGHNWFYGVLANNERRYAWMDEGINSFYDARYEKLKYPEKEPLTWMQKRIPQDQARPILETFEKIKWDQPVNTPSDSLNKLNYLLMSYEKPVSWLKQVEDSIGTNTFDSAMRTYFREHQFQHVNPEDLQAALEKTSGKNLSSEFDLLNKKGPLPGQQPASKKIKLAFPFNFRNGNKFNYVNILPGIGYNVYDQFMIGVVVHNFNLPPSNFEFVLAPLYATGSKQLVGAGSMRYSWYPDGTFSKIRASAGIEKFSSLSAVDHNGKEIYGGFYRFTPAVRFVFKAKSPLSSVEKSLEWKTFIIGERGFTYTQDSTDSMYYPTTQSYAMRYLNQLTYTIDNNRVLYPYNLQFQVQQASEFYRLNATANYYFNYAGGGGMKVRFFAAKFGYIGGKTEQKESNTESFQPKLTAVRGNEDYTYSNAFMGRNEFEGLPSQQIMMRDGGLKLRTDIFQEAGLQGRSDNWVAAMNFNTSLPNKLFPVRLPIYVFFDVGTYSGAWDANPPTSRFLFVGGLQVSVLKNLINVYIPLFYSSDFSSRLKSVPEENTLGRKISFSIDIQNVTARKLISKSPF